MRKGVLFLSFLLAACFAGALEMEKQDALLRDFLWDKLVAMPKEERPAVGVALSAGGARGFAHVGVLEVFINAGLPIDYMSGTSMGSVVGSIYASGHSIKEMWAMGEAVSLSTVSEDANLAGFLKFFLTKKLPSSANFEKFINEKTEGKTFEQLNIPFSCAAMDIKTGEKVLFDSGPVAIAVRASMNLPGVFEPVQYKQRLLVDGGVVDYLPVDILRKQGAEYVIAVLPLQDFSATAPETVAQYFIRTGDIRGAIINEETLRKADFALKPIVTGVSVLEVEALLTAGEKGLIQAYKDLPALKESLLLFTYENKK